MKLAKSAGKTHTGKFVAYYRVSTQAQGKSGLGLEAQQAAVKTFLNGGEWELVGEFTEVESGTRKASARRPMLAAAIAQCKAEKATLLVAKMDRMYRNVAAMATFMESGVEWIAVDNPHLNKFTAHILAAVAEHEADMISERTTAALQAVKARGTKLGSPNPKAGSVVGVKVLKDDADDFAALIMPHIREIQGMGYTTLRQIATGLTNRGVQTRHGSTTWHPSQVSNLLKRVV
jgi:DNA invertase Pin-like site-specific DNA recombinase